MRNFEICSTYAAARSSTKATSACIYYYFFLCYFFLLLFHLFVLLAVSIHSLTRQNRPQLLQFSCFAVRAFLFWCAHECERTYCRCLCKFCCAGRTHNWWWQQSSDVHDYPFKTIKQNGRTAYLPREMLFIRHSGSFVSSCIEMRSDLFFLEVPGTQSMPFSAIAFIQFGFLHFTGCWFREELVGLCVWRDT